MCENCLFSPVQGGETSSHCGPFVPLFVSSFRVLACRVGCVVSQIEGKWRRYVLCVFLCRYQRVGSPGATPLSLISSFLFNIVSSSLLGVFSLLLPAREEGNSPFEGEIPDPDYLRHMGSSFSPDTFPRKEQRPLRAGLCQAQRSRSYTGELLLCPQEQMWHRILNEVLVLLEIR